MSHEDRGRPGLLVDWGGVMTTDVFVSFAAFCRREDLAEDAVARLFRADLTARGLLAGLETGAVTEQEFEQGLAELLGVPAPDLIKRLMAEVRAEPRMVEAVRAARQAGIAAGLVSNSWGVHRYPHDLFDELFDGVVISGVEGTRKPAKRMYELGAERAGVAAELCVFVDDLPFNLTPAEELGMATVHHTSAETTIPELEALLGVPLSG